MWWNGEVVVVVVGGAVTFVIDAARLDPPGPTVTNRATAPTASTKTVIVVASRAIRLNRRRRGAAWLGIGSLWLRPGHATPSTEFPPWAECCGQGDAPRNHPSTPFPVRLCREADGPVGGCGMRLTGHRGVTIGSAGQLGHNGPPEQGVVHTPPTTKGDPMSTEETRTVVERHMVALQSGDIDLVMEDYTDDSVFIINLGGVFKGKESIRPFFEASGSMPGFTETAAYAEGDAYFVTWTADGIDLGSDTLIVRDGKIALQTVVVVLAS